MKAPALFLAAALMLSAAACRPATKTEANLSAQQAQALLEADQEVQLVDVRTIGEWNTGHLEKARHIPIDQFERRLVELDKGKPVLTYCASGGRSSVSLMILEEHGFKQASHIDGGISAWRRAGLKTVQD